MTTPTLPPETITRSGRTLQVTRAWPVPDEARLAIECQDAGQRIAGHWDHNGAQLQPLGSDSRIPALERLAATGTVVSHRPGKRAVVRRDEEFIKVVRRGRASGILDGVRRAAAFTDFFRTPEVLAQDDSSVTFAELHGASLHDPSLLSAPHWDLAWTEVLSAWAEAASTAGSSSSRQDSRNHTPGTRPSQLRHTAEVEGQVLRRWASLVAPYLDPAERLHRLVDDVATSLGQLPEVPLRPAHRDLHDKQLLLSPQAGPGLLDVDTACVADPALDLGNLRAHARLRRLQGLWGPAEARTVTQAVDVAAARLHVPTRTLAIYERAAELRLGCVYAVRPGYRDVAARLRAGTVSSAER